MGKTFIQILEVAAVVGAQFVPGLGIAVAGVTIASGTVATAAVVLGEAILNATVLAPKSPKPATTETALKSARPARISGYAMTRARGVYIAADIA
jgi:hypothetical protein